MKHVELSVNGMDLDYKTANDIAQSVARTVEKEPTVVAWHDGPRGKMSPQIEGADINTRWHDYGQANGGELSISVNGDFDFIFADGDKFEELGEGPYLNVQDAEGHQYLCLPENLRDPSNPNEQACLQLDTQTRSQSALHGG